MEADDSSCHASADDFKFDQYRDNKFWSIKWYTKGLKFFDPATLLQNSVKFLPKDDHVDWKDFDPLFEIKK